MPGPGLINSGLARFGYLGIYSISIRIIDTFGQALRLFAQFEIREARKRCVFRPVEDYQVPKHEHGAADPIGGVSVFEAVDKQLGLKLVEQKRPVSVLVIDHIEEKPTDN